MAREFFKNLPNTTTPLNAQRMNRFLNGGEAMGSIVVDDISCKNILDTSNLKGKNGISATKKEKGLWLFNGTPTSNYTHFLDVDESILTDGEPYTFSSTNYNTQVYLQVERKNISTGATNYYATQNGSFTLTIDKSTYSYGISINTHSITSTGTISNLEVGWQIEKGQTATEYAEYKNFDNTEHLLYSGNSTETITLTETSENFKYIDIYYGTDNDRYNYVRVYKPNGKTVSLTGIFSSAVGMMYIRNRVIQINGNTIETLDTSRHSSVAINTNGTIDYVKNDNLIWIKRVVGYKSSVGVSTSTTSLDETE